MINPLRYLFSDKPKRSEKRRRVLCIRPAITPQDVPPAEPDHQKEIEWLLLRLEMVETLRKLGTESANLRDTLVRDAMEGPGRRAEHR